MCTGGGCQVTPESWPRVDYDPVTDLARLAQRTSRAGQAQLAGTVFLVDLASYQEGIDLDAVKAAGFTAVNIKLTQGNWYTWERGGFYADWARQLGMGVSGFSWIDNSASGAEQAAYAWRQHQAIGAVWHQCDCEDSARPASWQTWVDYIRWWQARGAPVCNYTGDWWWPAYMGARGAEVCPLLWAAPNDGYLPAYPGNTSAAWWAGYGGWGNYALLQYAVQPIDGAGGGNLSKTAIRDPAVWAALTGGGEVGMEQSDLVKGWDGQTRPVQIGWVLGDQANLRDWWHTAPDARTIMPPPPGSRADLLIRAAQAIPEIRTKVLALEAAPLTADDLARIVAEIRAGLPTAADVAAELVRQLGG
jgi:hypothetical protein